VLEQLNNGVRFLDLRVSCPPFTTTPEASSPSPFAPELALVHSAFPVSLTGSRYLSELLTTLYNFLDEHPSETILLSLKREGTGRGTDQDLSRILHHHYITPAKWYTDPEIPTLGRCRGRIILVRRFHLHPDIPDSKGGIDGSDWPDNVADGMCGSGTIRIQDYYGVSNTTEIQRKVRYAQEGLERAGAEVLAKGTRGQQPLFINFLSASNFFNASCWPDRIAVKMNPSMIEHLCMAHGKLDTQDSTTGIIVLDWVGRHGDWDIVRCIVGWNARLQLRQ
jgi:1-phosphatidylinositol phosphodiesterase